MKSIFAAMLLLPLMAAPGMAQTTSLQAQPTIVVVQPPSFPEAAVASCAGGAMIGYLMVLISGVGSPLATPAMFCGLSVAAGTASRITAWTFRGMSALAN